MIASYVTLDLINRRESAQFCLPRSLKRGSAARKSHTRNTATRLLRAEALKQTVRVCLRARLNTKRIETNYFQCL
jgi:hypothetical protein